MKWTYICADTKANRERFRNDKPENHLIHHWANVEWTRYGLDWTEPTLAICIDGPASKYLEMKREFRKHGELPVRCLFIGWPFG